jgi:hypothetical protein
MQSYCFESPITVPACPSIKCTALIHDAEFEMMGRGLFERAAGQKVEHCG